MEKTNEVVNVQKINTQDSTNTNGNNNESSSTNSILQQADIHSSVGTKLVFSREDNNKKSETNKGENK